MQESAAHQQPAPHKSGSTRQGSLGGKKGHVSNSIQFQVNSFQGPHPGSGTYAGGSSTNI